MTFPFPFAYSIATHVIGRILFKTLSVMNNNILEARLSINIYDRTVMMRIDGIEFI